MLPLFLLFTLLPALELYLIITIGARIGVLNTVLVIIGTGVLGTALARNEGLMVLEKIRRAVARGEMPQDSIVDGLLILVAGALLVTPGFFTDALGLLALFPLTRPLIRRPILARLRARMVTRRPGGAPGAGYGAGKSSPFDEDRPWPPKARDDAQIPPGEVRIDAIEKPPQAGDDA